MVIDELFDEKLSPEEFKIQKSLGTVYKFDFFDKNIDETGWGNGPFRVWAKNYRCAVQIYLQKYAKGFSAVKLDSKVTLWMPKGM